jgi:hypothetical protein
MKKTPISSTDLLYLFVEKLRDFADGNKGIRMAIVPIKGAGEPSSWSDWTTVINNVDRKTHSETAEQIAEIEKALRKKYVLQLD